MPLPYPPPPPSPPAHVASMGQNGAALASGTGTGVGTGSTMGTATSTNPATSTNTSAATAASGWNVGPHLVVGFSGTRPTDAGVQALRQQAEAGQIGGVVFFGYNVESPAQLRQLTSAMAAWQVPEASRPLLLMADQEGGQVQRLPPERGFDRWPEPQALGEGPVARAQSSFTGMAAELRAAGINVNLAPVADLQREGGIIGPRHRSFGRDPKQVARLAGLQVAAHARAGLLSAVKHFPGHGLSPKDPHRGPVDATHTWQRRELMPFAELLRAGGVDLLMSSHLVQRELEPSGVPLTFSRAVMQILLRQEMGYSGTLMTDDLGMGAIAAHYPPEQSVLGALAAGHDLLLFGLNQAARGPGPSRHQPIDDLFSRADMAVATGLQQGLLTPAVLAQSDARLRTLRQRLRALQQTATSTGD